MKQHCPHMHAPKPKCQSVILSLWHLLCRRTFATAVSITVVSSFAPSCRVDVLCASTCSRYSFFLKTRWHARVQGIFEGYVGDIVPDPTQIISLGQTSRAAAAQRGGPLCSVHMLSLPLRPPMPPSQGCERLHSPFGLLTFRARIIFLAVRWIEKQKY